MRRKLIALIVAVVAFSLIAASAASLGGITTEGVGANNVVVDQSCETDNSGVDVTWRVRWDAAAQIYELRRVIITGIHDDCLSQRISMTIVHPGGQLSRGPSGIQDRPGVDNNRRRWGVANGNIDVSQDFTIHIAIAP